MAYYSRLDFESARGELQAGVDLLGEEAEIEHLFYLALAYYYSEPPSAISAVPALNDVLEIDPTNAIAQSALANCGAQAAGGIVRLFGNCVTRLLMLLKKGLSPSVRPAGAHPQTPPRARGRGFTRLVIDKPA